MAGVTSMGATQSGRTAGKDWFQIGDAVHPFGRLHSRFGPPPWGDDAGNDTHGHSTWQRTIMWSRHDSRSAPDCLLLLAILELPDAEDRKRALHTDVVKLVCMRGETVGPWIVRCLQDRKKMARVTDYLFVLQEQVCFASSIPFFFGGGRACI